MYLDRQAFANSVDPDQTPQNAASDQVQHCLLLSSNFVLDIRKAYTIMFKIRKARSKLIFEFYDKYGNELSCLNTYGKYSTNLSQ